MNACDTIGATDGLWWANFYKDFDADLMLMSKYKTTMDWGPTTRSVLLYRRFHSDAGINTDCCWTCRIPVRVSVGRRYLVGKIMSPPPNVQFPATRLKFCVDLSIKSTPKFFGQITRVILAKMSFDRYFCISRVFRFFSQNLLLRRKNPIL